MKNKIDWETVFTVAIVGIVTIVIVVGTFFVVAAEGELEQRHMERVAEIQAQR